MSYPRVNLLKKSERRYQGVVSMRFIYVGIVVTPVLSIAILSGIKLFQYNQVQSELRGSRTVWANMEPRLKLFKDEQRSLSSNRKALKLFEGWTNSQVSFVELLSDIQGTVPQEIQFTRLSIRAGATASVYTDPETLGLDYTLLIEGVSQGRRAEDEVIKLHKDLLETQGVSAAFESINLASMRKRKGSKGVNLREFRLEGQGLGGGGK